MIRVVIVDEKTGERSELKGSRVIVLVGEGDQMEMTQAGEARGSEVACAMLDEAHEKLHEGEDLPPVAIVSAYVH